MTFLIIILVLLMIIYGASVITCYLTDAPKGLMWKPLMNSAYAIGYLTHMK